MALTKAIIICCNSANMTSNSKLTAQKTPKTQKDKKLIPQCNK